VGGRSEPAVPQERRAAPEGPKRRGGAARSAACDPPLLRDYRVATPTSASSKAGGQTPSRQRDVCSTQARSAARLPGGANTNALSNPVGRRGGVRAGVCPSRRRALRPDRVCHAAIKGMATPGGFAEVRQSALKQNRVPLGGHRPPTCVSDRNPDWTKSPQRGSAPRCGLERGVAEGSKRSKDPRSQTRHLRQSFYSCGGVRGAPS